MVTMRVETITPEQAKEYLRFNTANYRGTTMSRAKVKQYAESMKSGRWQMNGEAIQFDENGILKNGQHRLAAIIMAGVPVEIMVIRGIDKTVDTYDMGWNRTLVQMANARNLSFDKHMLCMVNLYMQLQNGSTDKVEVVDYAQKHEDEINRAWRCMLNGNYTKNVRKASLMLASYMMLATRTMPFYELEVFFKVFSTMEERGCDGYEVSPALVARRMFDERYKTGSNQRMQREQLDITIQAMNDLHAGKKRTNNYKVMQPFSYEPLLKAMREG